MRTPFVMPERREVFPGVSRKQYGWGWLYKGKRAALVAAGIVDNACFPGEPGQFKTTAYGMKDGRTIHVYSYGSRHTFDVRVSSKEGDIDWNKGPDQLGKQQKNEGAALGLTSALPQILPYLCEAAYQKISELPEDAREVLPEYISNYFRAPSENARNAALAEIKHLCQAEQNNGVVVSLADWRRRANHD